MKEPKNEKEQELVNAWEMLRFVYPNEIGGIENPYDEDFMLTKEASNAWKGVQKKYFSKHKKSMRSYKDVLNELDSYRGYNKWKVKFRVSIRRFPLPIINPPDKDYCNVIMEDSWATNGLGHRRCATPGGTWYKNRILCHHHEDNIPCDICWTPRAFPCQVLSKPDLTSSGQWLGKHKPFSNTQILTKQFLVKRFYWGNEPELAKFNTVTGEYWLCEECERSLEKSLIRHRKKLGLMGAVERRDIRRARETIKEINKLLKEPKYRRQIQNDRMVRNEKST